MPRISSKNPFRSSTFPTNTSKPTPSNTPPRASTLPTSTPTSRPTTPAATSPATRPTTPATTSPATRPTTPGATSPAVTSPATTPGATTLPGAANTPADSGNGQHHYSAQTEIQGPSASYQAQGAHAGRFGVTSGQVTANATSFKGQAQAGVSADTNSHAYTAALTGKAETGVGVTASANHDFNRHVGGYVKGEAKAGASAYAEGVATVDPRTATAMVSGQVGAGATAGVYGTAGGHLGRLHGSVTGGAVAGAAAQAGGKFGIENGFLKTGANVNAAAGVGTSVQADAALDLRHHIKPGIAAGLRPGIAAATGAAVPGQTLQPEQSWIQRHLPW